MMLRSRHRLSDVAKCLALLIAGYALRILTEWLAAPSSHACKMQCPSLPSLSADELTPDAHTQLTEPFKPDDIHEVLTYDYFNATHAYSRQHDADATGTLLHHQRNDITDIIKHTIANINHGQDVAYKLHNLVNGYKRYDPLRGEEYILDLDLVPSTPLPVDTDNTRTHVYKRVGVVKPFGVPQIVHNAAINKDKLIHIIVPVSSVVLERFQNFLLRYEELCLTNRDQNVYLMVMLFEHEGHAASVHAANTVRSMLTALSRRHRAAHIRTVVTSRPFSISLALDLGIRQLPRDTLVFMCDVDMKFDNAFLNRCRNNAVQGRRVYYPIMYGLYDPEIVQLHSGVRVHNLTQIHVHTGRWLYNSYSAVCLHTSDYHHVAGMDASVTGVATEHERLYAKHVTSHIEVIRSYDSGLLHLYHSPTPTDDQLVGAPPPGGENTPPAITTPNTALMGSQLQLANKLQAVMMHCENPNHKKTPPKS